MFWLWILVKELKTICDLPVPNQAKSKFIYLHQYPPFMVVQFSFKLPLIVIFLQKEFRLSLRYMEGFPNKSIPAWVFKKWITLRLKFDIFSLYHQGSVGASDILGKKFGKVYG